MSMLQTIAAALMPASPEALEKLQSAHEAMLQCEQTPITTEHLIHGGMYSRTIRLEPGTVIMGSLLKLATVLIVEGTTSVLSGDERIKLHGYNVIPGCAGRKQLFVAHSPVVMTMIFPTQAKTVEEAEDEVFAEASLLMSRQDANSNIITITGE